MEGEVNHINSFFTSLYHLFCGFKNAQKQPCVCALQKVFFKMLQNLQKITSAGVCF